MTKTGRLHRTGAAIPPPRGFYGCKAGFSP